MAADLPLRLERVTDHERNLPLEFIRHTFLIARAAPAMSLGTWKLDSLTIVTVMIVMVMDICCQAVY